MSHSVPPEVARKILRLLNDKRMLAVLARTTRNFQVIAERYLYNEIFIIPHPDKILLLESLKRVPRVAQLVRYFKFSIRPPRNLSSAALHSIATYTAEEHDFWLLLRDAIHKLGNLERFEIDDEPFMADDDRHVHSALLSPPPGLRANEIRLSFPLNDHVCAFLATQTTVRKLRMPEFTPSDNEDNLFANLPNLAMPNLTLFEGSIFNIDQLLDCPITRLKVTLDSSEAIDALPRTLKELYRFKNLYSLSIVNWPPENVLSLVDVISYACPNLSYLSVVPYSVQFDIQRELFRILGRLKKLRVLQIDVTEWRPVLLGRMQRTIATELRLYIPTLVFITFWTSHERTHWCFSVDRTKPTLAVRPRRGGETLGSTSSGSRSGGGKAAESAVDVDEEMNGIGTHQTSHDELDEARLEGRVIRYIGLDGWVGHVQHHSNAHWTMAASKDDMWGNSYLENYANGTDPANALSSQIH